VKKRSTKEILQQNLKRSSPLQNTFILWLHDIRSLHNVGAAFRSADAFGIKEVLLSGYTPIPPRAEITKTAIGAEEHVDWKQIKDIKKTASELKSDGYTILGLEQTENSKMIHEYIPDSPKICLVLGNEVTGISDDMLPSIDEAVEIPQFGMKHSLNVSVAAGVALYAFFQIFNDQNFQT
jgi:23S rRNA (guanosine2251-2'-O)-methyltransferase